MRIISVGPTCQSSPVMSARWNRRQWRYTTSDYTVQAYSRGLLVGRPVGQRTGGDQSRNHGAKLANPTDKSWAGASTRAVRQPGGQQRPELEVGARLWTGEAGIVGPDARRRVALPDAGLRRT